MHAGEVRLRQCQFDVALAQRRHPVPALAASRTVTRAYGASQFSRSSFRPHPSHWRRNGATISSTATSKVGKSPPAAPRCRVLRSPTRHNPCNSALCLVPDAAESRTSDHRHSVTFKFFADLRDEAAGRSQRLSWCCETSTGREGERWLWMGLLPSLGAEMATRRKRHGRRTVCIIDLDSYQSLDSPTEFC